MLSISMLARPLNFMSATKLIILPFMVYLKTRKKNIQQVRTDDRPQKDTNVPPSGLRHINLSTAIQRPTDPIHTSASPQQ